MSVTGGNSLFRWNRETGAYSGWTIQAYYDRTDRVDPTYRYQRNTVDLDFLRRRRVGTAHELVWGANYRIHADDYVGSESISTNPETRTYDRVSWFAQDQISLVDDELYFLMGSKFEHNDFSGFEVMPTARLLWLPSPQRAIWTAVSRAVRRPFRYDNDGQVRVSLPPPLNSFAAGQVIPNRNLDAETLLAVELGYREQRTESFYWDASVFYHHYDELVGPQILGIRSVFPLPVVFDVTSVNKGPADSFGVELVANWDLTDHWTVHGAYSFEYLDNLEQEHRLTPRNQLYLRSGWDLLCDWKLDLTMRFVDNILDAPAYTETDVRLAWTPRDNLELAIVGLNLIDNKHPEFGTPTSLAVIDPRRTEVERSFYGMATLTW